jgi:hypothetical protein
MKETFGVHLQCHKNKKATEFCVAEFRKFNKENLFRVVSDNGDDYSYMIEKYGISYKFEPKSSMSKGCFNEFDGMSMYLNRIKETCIEFDTDWIMIFEDDVLTKREIKNFPESPAAGLCAHKLRNPMENKIRKLNPNAPIIGYGMCGGSIFRRIEFLECMKNMDNWYDVESGWIGNGLLFFETLDKRIVHYGDIALSVLFLANGYEYSLWSELEQGGSRGGEAAFEHNFKKHY